MAAVLPTSRLSPDDADWIERCARRMADGHPDIAFEQAVGVARELASDLGCRAASPESLADRMTWGIRAKHAFGPTDPSQLEARLQSRTVAIRKLFQART